jgi:hypothetical protein
MLQPATYVPIAAKWAGRVALSENTVVAALQNMNCKRTTICLIAPFNKVFTPLLALFDKRHNLKHRPMK